MQVGSSSGTDATDYMVAIQLCFDRGTPGQIPVRYHVLHVTTTTTTTTTAPFCLRSLHLLYFLELLGNSNWPS